jgi:hypothetical protein
MFETAGIQTMFQTDFASIKKITSLAPMAPSKQKLKTDFAWQPC